MLDGRGADGTIGKHPYRKWQGPHWTLYSLALIDYLRATFRFCRCASQEGNPLVSIEALRVLKAAGSGAG